MRAPRRSVVSVVSNSSMARVGLAALTVGLVSAGCGAARAGTAMAESPASACGPIDGTLQADASFDGMEGRYRLVMGPPEGGAPRVEGVLALRPQPEALAMMEGAATPLGGTAAIDLAAAGAQPVAGLDADDPAAPGVLVIDEDGGGILLRFGSEANRRDQVAFDGAYTVLSVSTIDRDGFAGTWRSGLRARTREGYFCAWRTASRP